MGQMRRLKGLSGAFHKSMQVLDRPARWMGVANLGRRHDESTCDLTLVFTMHPKDMDVAHTAVEYARRHVLHPIKECVIVAPDDGRVRSLCREQGCRFIDERDLLPITLKQINDRFDVYNLTRGNWIYQQLLKLAIDQAIDTECWLNIDSDTLLMRPRCFKRNNVRFQEFSHERNHLYLKSYEKLLGPTKFFPFSFVTHYMFGEKTILRALQRSIEDRTSRRWFEAILELGDPVHWSSEDLATTPFNYFSEYETYSTFSLSHYDKVKFSYFMNRGAADFAMGKDKVEDYAQSLPCLYKWASFHSYYYPNPQR